MKRSTIGTQEAWVVISGKLLAEIYDIDDSVLKNIIIEEGGAIILYRGGHALEVLEDNTIFYEFKNGPYGGIENDKKQID